MVRNHCAGARAIMSICAAIVLVVVWSANAAAQPRPGGPNRLGVPPVATPRGPDAPGPISPYSGPQWIDTHVHLRAPFGDFAGALAAAVAAMDGAGIRKMLVLPPPFTDRGVPNWHDYQVLKSATAAYPQRFAFLGGSELNAILAHADAAAVTAEQLSEFERAAMRVVASGAVGFGEFGVLHLSHFPGHPFEEVAPDHPLLLRLADIAARERKPIDIHMDVVDHQALLPARYASPPNPRTLTENVRALERLLAHNRAARIIWAHGGWDVTGQWSAAVTRRMLQANSNLFISLKLVPIGTPASMPVTPAGVKPDWQQLFIDFPDRFTIGTDSFFAAAGPGPGSDFRPQLTQALLRSLPPPVAAAIAGGNAERIYGLSGR